MVMQSRKQFLQPMTLDASANREHDRLRDQIAGEDPGSLTDAGTEIASNEREGHIFNRGI
jgi:hypothetical protein